MSKHVNGNLKFGFNNGGGENYLTFNNDLIATHDSGCGCCWSNPNEQERANLERIMACWNACVGIDDPLELRKQRDELVEVLRALHTYPGVRELLAPIESLGSIKYQVESALSRLGKETERE